MGGHQEPCNPRIVKHLVILWREDRNIWALPIPSFWLISTEIFRLYAGRLAQMLPQIYKAGLQMCVCVGGTLNLVFCFDFKPVFVWQSWHWPQHKRSAWMLEHCFAPKLRGEEWAGAGAQLWEKALCVNEHRKLLFEEEFFFNCNWLQELKTAFKPRAVPVFGSTRLRQHCFVQEQVHML